MNGKIEVGYCPGCDRDQLANRSLASYRRERMRGVSHARCAICACVIEELRELTPEDFHAWVHARLDAAAARRRAAAAG